MSGQEQFHDPKYCYSEICEIRKWIGQKTANERTFQNAFNTLTLMLIHAPQEVVPAVQAQLLETNTRYTYAMMRPGFFI